MYFLVGGAVGMKWTRLVCLAFTEADAVGLIGRRGLKHQRRSWSLSSREGDAADRLSQDTTPSKMSQ